MKTLTAALILFVAASGICNARVVVNCHREP